MRCVMVTVLRSLLIGILLPGSLTGCGSADPQTSVWKPAPTFTEATLVGHWQTSDTQGTIEVLTMQADHTFQHTIDAVIVPQHVHSTGTWRLERRASGCAYLHLPGAIDPRHGLDLPNGNRTLDGTPYPYWEVCEDRTITMPDELLLIVGNLPNLVRQTALFFPRMGAESGDTWMDLGLAPVPTI